MSKQTIYNRLRSPGLSQAGALALLGNFECESNCEACRLQGDFSKDRASSKAYAASNVTYTMSSGKLNIATTAVMTALVIVFNGRVNTA